MCGCVCGVRLCVGGVAVCGRCRLGARMGGPAAELRGPFLAADSGGDRKGPLC